LDLFDLGLMLLLALGGEAWRRAATAAAEGLGLPLQSYVISEPEFPDAYGITGAGAALVRWLIAAP
jgi:hypothetical protein